VPAHLNRSGRPDGDGLGDHCDNCAFHAESRSTQLEPRRRGEGLRPKPAQPTFATELTTKYPGDACDPHPLSLIEVTGGKYAPLDGTRNIACIREPGLLCGGADVRGTCGLPKNNVILSHGIVGGPAQHGVTRVLQCACSNRMSAGECEATGCPRESLQALGGWAHATIADADVKSQSSVLSDPATSGVRQTYVDVSRPGTEGSPQWWGWAYWRDIGLPLKAPTPDPMFPDNPYRTKATPCSADGLTVRAHAAVTAPPPGFNASPTGSTKTSAFASRYRSSRSKKSERPTLSRPWDDRFYEQRLIDAPIALVRKKVAKLNDELSAAEIPRRQQGRILDPRRKEQGARVFPGRMAGRSTPSQATGSRSRLGRRRRRVHRGRRSRRAVRRSREASATPSSASRSARSVPRRSRPGSEPEAASNGTHVALSYGVIARVIARGSESASRVTRAVSRRCVGVLT
jgi:hypothetical protein